MDGLAGIHIELTSRCNKACWMCGRRRIEKERPDLAEWGDMPFDMLESIAKQTPPNIEVQLHNNGEPLMYPRFGDAVKLFRNQITSIDTNGKLICEKANEIIDNLDTMAISVIEGDVEAGMQMSLIRSFLRIRGKRKPTVVLRLNGNVDRRAYEGFGLLIATRVLHNPMGSFSYAKNVTVPEIGICWEMMHRLAIDRYGDVSICVRFDPDRVGVLGNVKDHTLEEMWNGEKRALWLGLHKQGKRDLVPLCSECDYWGVPTGW